MFFSSETRNNKVMRMNIRHFVQPKKNRTDGSICSVGTTNGQFFRFAAVFLGKMVFVVLLQCKRMIIVPRNFIQTAQLGRATIIFHSPDEEKEANFDAERKFLFDKDSDATYEAYVMKSFGTKFLISYWL